MPSPMTRRRFVFTALLLAAALLLAPAAQAAAADPLPSWNQGAVKQAIVDFVAKVTKEGGPGFVPPDERIAVFDNDGTLWVEQPMYTQMIFALDRLRALAPRHPEWKDKEPFKSALAGDMKAVAASGAKGITELVMAVTTGMTTAEFEAEVESWLKTARHPRFKQPFTALVYQPMLELLAYLRANGFKTFIVSGGGIDFMRPWTQRVYGIPPEQVVGTTVLIEFEMKDGQPVLVRKPKITFIDDKEGKPVGIHLHIGRRPILAAGNSDGDLAMLQWTAAGPGPSLMLILHHDDAEREYAYDRQSPVGHLDKALDQALERGWSVISMKNDFARVFPGR